MDMTQLTMDMPQLMALVLVAGIGGGALYCYCKAKTKGFGPYNTSTLSIILVLTLTGILGIGGYLGKQAMANILLAIIGFIAGIFTKEKNQQEKI